MEQKKNRGAVIKGLAFPIGYFVFMNVVQTVLLYAYMLFRIIRDIFIPMASVSAGPEQFLRLITDLQDSPRLEYYINETLLPELMGAPAYVLSVLTSLITIVILWLVFNRKNRDFKEYFGFKPASFRALAAAVLLGLGFYFLVNAVLTVINMISTPLILDVFVPAIRNAADQLMQAGLAFFADILTTAADTIETKLTEPAIIPPLGWFTVAAILLAPLVEELIFRAGAIRNLRQKLPMVATILLSSLLFSLAHIGSLNLWQLLYTFILGAAAALLYVWSDSIYPAIVCHFCFNGANIVSLTIYKLFSLDLIETTEQGNHFVGENIFVVPNPDVLMTWGNVLTLLFLFATAILSIPMLIVGVFLLIGMRPKKQAGQMPAVTAQPAPTVLPLTSDEPQVITAEPSLSEQSPEEEEAALPQKSLEESSVSTESEAQA